MVSAEHCTKLPGITQGDDSSGDSGEHYGPEKAEEEATGSVMPRRPKPKVSRKVASKGKGRQLEKRHDEGELSKLPDMPLDVLYQVSPRINSIPMTGCLMISLAFADIRFRPPDGSTAGVVDQQGFS